MAGLLGTAGNWRAPLLNVPKVNGRSQYQESAVNLTALMKVKLQTQEPIILQVLHKIVCMFSSYICALNLPQNAHQGNITPCRITLARIVCVEVMVDLLGTAGKCCATLLCVLLANGLNLYQERDVNLTASRSWGQEPGRAQVVIKSIGISNTSLTMGSNICENN